GWQAVGNVISEVSSDFDVFVNKPATIERACQIADKYQYSFYDSLIIAVALSCNCKTLYSEDMQDGQVIENSLTMLIRLNKMLLHYNKKPDCSGFFIVLTIFFLLLPHYSKN